MSLSISLRSLKKWLMTFEAVTWSIIGPVITLNEVNTFLILLIMQYSYPPCFLIGLPSLMYNKRATLAHYILNILFYFSFSIVSFIILRFLYKSIYFTSRVMPILYLFARMYLSTIYYLFFLNSVQRCYFKMVMSLT